MRGASIGWNVTSNKNAIGTKSNQGSDVGFGWRSNALLPPPSTMSSSREFIVARWDDEVHRRWRTEEDSFWFQPGR